MKVAIDLDGTITCAPDFFRAEMRGLMDKGDEVHVLTGNPKAKEVLTQLGLVRGRDFTTVVTVPLKGIARFKVAYMHHAGVTHLVDNSGKNIKAARRAGFTGHWYRAPKKKG